jgi:hypothetical protein
MKTETAIAHAGSPKALAELLGITPSAISQWGEDMPEGRMWQLRVLRPEWFEGAPVEERKAA